MKGALVMSLFSYLSGADARKKREERGRRDAQAMAQTAANIRAGRTCYLCAHYNRGTSRCTLSGGQSSPNRSCPLYQ